MTLFWSEFVVYHHQYIRSLVEFRFKECNDPIGTRFERLQGKRRSKAGGGRNRKQDGKGTSDVQGIQFKQEGETWKAHQCTRQFARPEKACKKRIRI